jgi:LptD protein
MSAILCFGLKIQRLTYKFLAILGVVTFFINPLTIAQTKDSILNSVDTSKKALINKDSSAVNYKIATNDLKTPVNYNSEDSIVYDAKMKQFYIYKNAKIVHDDLNLNSDFIAYNLDSSTLSASRLDSIVTDSTQLPNFKQGEQEFTFDTLLYNFKSQRAFVEGAKTQYGEGYIISEGVKRNPDKSISGIGNTYTTCNADIPHFGIAAKRIKVIPDVAGISGPAHVVIEQIHTPLYLPFGIYPLKKGQNAGFILPKYGFEQNRGFGLTQGGYYIPINEYLDMKILTDIFSLGSWSAGAQLNYNKRYSFSGSFGLNYSKIKSESNVNTLGFEDNTFRMDWGHRVDPKKLKGAIFNADVHISSSNNNRINFYNNVNNILNNTLTSNISYQKSFNNGRYNFSSTMSHEQNNSTRLFKIKLPELAFNASGITPFARKNNVGAPKWYDKIQVNYSNRLLNQLEFYDSAFSFKNLAAENFNNGFIQTLSTSYNQKILKYVNFNIGANYNEYWYTKKTFRSYNLAEQRLDTLVFKGFKTARSFNTSAGLSTNIYGLVTRNKGAIRGLRHVAMPSIGLSYTPSFGSGIYNYWYSTFINSSLTPVRLSYFQDGILGGPTDAENGSITFGLRNTLEAKILNKKDSLGGFKKIRILDNFSFATSYNIAADSFNWSNLSLNYSSSLFDNRLGINGSTNWDPYGVDYSNGRRTKAFAYHQNDKLLRLLNTDLNLQTSFRSKNKLDNTKATDKEELGRAMEFRPNQYLDFNIPWSIGLRVSAGMNPIYLRTEKRDSIVKELNFTADGDISLTEYWKITYQTGYDFIAKKVNVSNFSLVRDLHCWTLSIGMIPSGDYRSYTISLAPKSTMLQDVRLSRNKSFWDAR